jgi:hypothetical protein
MNRKYNSEGYDKNRGIIEKMVFSFPEYLMYETRFGNKFAFFIIRVLSYLNRLIIENIPKTRKTITQKIMNFITYFFVIILNWINSFSIEKEEK